MDDSTFFPKLTSWYSTTTFRNGITIEIILTSSAVKDARIGGMLSASRPLSDASVGHFYFVIFVLHLEHISTSWSTASSPLSNSLSGWHSNNKLKDILLDLSVNIMH